MSTKLSKLSKEAKNCQKLSTSTQKQKAENLEDMQRKANIASKIQKMFHHFPAKKTFSERKYSVSNKIYFAVERERERKVRGLQYSRLKDK